MTSAEQLPIARYRFAMRAEAPLTLREYPGSMLRGAFGHALKAVSCMTDRQDCTGCSLRESCRYPALFEPTPRLGRRQQLRDIPAPYILEAELDQGRELAAGESWSFHMVLFGMAIDQLPVIIMAWQRAATQGFGKGKARCRLESVDQVSADGKRQRVFNEDAPRVRSHDATLTIPTLPSCDGVTLSLLTPTRIQSRGKLCNSQELTASALLAALARKVELYLGYYAHHAWQRPAIPEDLTLTVTTRLQRWQRYSARQQQVMNLDGLVGQLYLEGALSEWLSWLWLGQFTHIGKNTSFGLGQYRLALS